MIAVPMQVAATQASIPVTVSPTTATVPTELNEAYKFIKREDHEHYEGTIEFTPTEEQQVISVENMILDTDIIINPIPTNYGLLTMVGSRLRIS